MAVARGPDYKLATSHWPRATPSSSQGNSWFGSGSSPDSSPPRGSWFGYGQREQQADVAAQQEQEDEQQRQKRASAIATLRRDVAAKRVAK